MLEPNTIGEFSNKVAEHLFMWDMLDNWHPLHGHWFSYGKII